MENVCFECGGKAEEQHHIIPRVLGGAKTIPLCSRCHMRVHDVESERRIDNHSENIKRGIANAKQQGSIWGRPAGTTKDNETLLKENKKVVFYLLTGDYSIRQIARLCINPATKKPISTATVQKIKKALKSLQKPSIMVVSPSMAA